MYCPLYTSELHMSYIIQVLSLIYFTNENIEVNRVRKGKKCNATKKNEILRYVARKNFNSTLRVQD